MENYIQEVLRTEASDKTEVIKRLSEIKTIRLLHAAMGMVTEAGEFLDALKKYIMYGKPLDETNLKEETGDLFWYSGLACDVLDTDFDIEQRRNIEKLKIRYPEKFTYDNAINRDLDAERKVLEE